VGAPVVGAVAEAYGPRSSLWVGGLVCAVSAVAAALWLRRARRPVVPELLPQDSLSYQA